MLESTFAAHILCRMSEACELCDEVRREPVLTGRDRQHGVAGTWQLTRCAGCGLVRIDPLPGAVEIAGFYPSGDYYAHRESGGTFREVHVSAFKRFVLRHRFGHPGSMQPWFLTRAAAWCCSSLISTKNLLPWVGDGDLLDVGCGVGSALHRLRAYGWNAQGVELDDAAAAVGRAHGLTIRTGELMDAAFPDRSFDVVRLSHVLEHARSPLAVLREIRRILRPGGRLWLALPNIASHDFARFGAAWFPLELPRHLYHFDPTTLQGLCERAGLQVLRIRWHTTPDMRMRSMQYAREDRAQAANRALRGKPLHRRRWLRRLMTPHVRWLDRIGRGDLMECTCTPKPGSLG